jgi:hypothetical protein
MTQVTGDTGIDQVQDGVITAEKFTAGGGLVTQSHDAPVMNTFQTCSTTLPFTDVIPTTAQGDLVQSVTVTPKRIGEKFKVTFTAGVGTSSSAGVSCAAIFAGSTCIGADGGTMNDNTAIRPYCIVGYFTAVSLSAITFTARVGPHTGTASVYVNGNGVPTRKFGGVMTPSLNVTGT